MKYVLGLALLFLLAVSSIGLPQSTNKEPATNNFKLDRCGKKSDRRYAVCRGPWSSKTVSLFNTWASFDTNPERRLRFPSPDGKKVIEVNGFHVRLRINGKAFWTPFGSMHDAEVGWAPDSTRLFVTWSETGELGAWHVQVFNVADDGLIEIKGVTTSASKDLLLRERRAPIPRWARHDYRPMWGTLDYCEPNIVGSQWLNSSSEILVSALVGPVGGCKYMGDFEVYRIEVVTGKILQAYPATEAHRIFGDDDLPIVLDGNEDL